MSFLFLFLNFKIIKEKSEKSEKKKFKTLKQKKNVKKIKEKINFDFFISNFAEYRKKTKIQKEKHCIPHLVVPSV